ncbi:hypothetical protein LGM85_29860 [Burkholderia multivorans]|uniref:hypothetical protein n=1 Tax=Burkholderia cepacia complex TaxID=87882 RepID=UPI001B9657E5|nr:MULTISPECIES: hypothetical protein [Burkholderia cepacia complex]MBR8152651.1 hypothetical protein [Burkholderia vietnamiensis]MCA8488135.1 hypothetical protein [Burkholderia multivorans]MCL4663280.1 hypothetical protein [Burkholderia multivorans]MCO1356795.1 hypothetical protein [Burkholderia multivorans]MCO1415001.1 hypothetical protein [Burkholderia multivorans]
MERKEDIIEVWLHVPNWWIDMADIDPNKESEEIAYRISDIPIMAIHSQRGLERFQSERNSIPGTAVILAKMQMEDMMEYANYFYSSSRNHVSSKWEPIVKFDIDHGKFKLPSSAANAINSRRKFR